MTKNTNWGNIIDGLQFGLIWFVIAVVIVCTCVLILFDVFVGAGTMYYLTGGNIVEAIAISLATTGLLMALMFTGYQLSQSINKTSNKVSYVVSFFALLVYCLDVYFDGLSADVMRYGQIIATRDVNHNLYRGLIGGLSSTGEAMAIAIILGMPVLKIIIERTIPESYRTYHPNQKPTQPVKRTYEMPTSIPRTAPTPRPAPKSDIPYPTYHPVGYGHEENET